MEKIHPEGVIFVGNNPVEYFVGKINLRDLADM